MGEIQPSAPSASAPAKDDIHVLVTGFGPWADNNVNPSYLIARALSSTLTLLESSRTIHIHTLPSPLPVTYHAIRTTVPPLLFPPVTHSPPPTFHLTLFIGLAAGTTHYKIETLARREPYTQPDGSGTYLSPTEASLWKDAYGAPEILRTGFDTEDVWRRWKEGCMDEDVRLSGDAGLFACEFVYFTGLVEYWRRMGPTYPAPVLFLHVPGGADEGRVGRGVRVAEALIRAAVRSGRETGRVG